MILAYLDPGSGSLILQAVLGGVAGIVVAARAWKAKLRGRKQSPEDAGRDQPVDEPVLTDEP